MLGKGALIAEKYRLQERIGSGGAAEVWRAVHEPLGRPVAIKLLDIAGHGSKARAERFLREARTAAALRHRHVVDILDFGSAAGRPFMVMELLEGQTLADRLASDPPLSDAAVLAIGAQIAEALAAVHEAGIVHRDVKPHNVFLVAEGDAWTPKLLDFGVSKDLGRAGHAPLTNTGAVVGTPHYMSPEQARGLRDLDARTDVCSLGVLLYQALSGCLPFDSENPGDILVMIVTREPRSLASLRPELAPAIARVVERAMARDRDRRFTTAAELRDALLAVLPQASDAPVERAPPPLASTTGQSAAAPPAPRGRYALALAVLLPLGLAAWGLWSRAQSSPAPAPVEEPLQPPTLADVPPPARARETAPSPPTEEPAPASEPEPRERLRRGPRRAPRPGTTDYFHDLDY